MFRFKVNLTVCFALAASICSFYLPASGQNSTGGTTSRTYNQMRPAASNLWGVHPTDPKDQNIQAVKESPQLPNLPAYSGNSKFDSGFVQTQDNGWTVYQLVYLVKAPLKDVKDWYQNAFNAYQWKTTQSGSQTLCAIDTNGNRCNINVNKFNQHGYETRLALRYNQAPTR